MPMGVAAVEYICLSDTLRHQSVKHHTYTWRRSVRAQVHVPTSKETCENSKRPHISFCTIFKETPYISLRLYIHVPTSKDTCLCKRGGLFANSRVSFDVRTCTYTPSMQKRPRKRTYCVCVCVCVCMFVRIRVCMCGIESQRIHVFVCVTCVWYCIRFQEMYKRDLHAWKKTHKKDLHKNRPFRARDWSSRNVAFYTVSDRKRPIYVKRDVQKRPICVKRDPPKWHTYKQSYPRYELTELRDLHCVRSWKTHICEKRCTTDSFICEKRPL